MGELICYAVVFLIEEIIAWLYYDQIFPEKKTSSHIIAVSFTSGYFILFLMSRIKNVVLNGIGFLLINTMILFINYRVKIISGLIHVGYMNIAMFGTELLVALVLSRFTTDFAAYLYDIEVTIILSILSRMTYFAVLQISAKLFLNGQNSIPDYSLTLLSFFPLLSILIGFAICFICLTAELSRATSVILLLAIFILLISNVLVMVVYRRVQKINDDRLHYAIHIQKETAKAEYYQMMQEQTNQYRILIHDIKKHIGVVSDLVEENRIRELKEYLDSLSRSSTLVDTKLSENAVMNSILSRYHKLCKEENIDCDIDVRYETVSSMNNKDITSLFDNLLSNAYEAAKASAQRYVSLTVRKEENNEILIKVVNSCDNPPIKNSQGKFITTKKDKTNHGLGLMSIENCVKKYNGHISMNYDSFEKTFTTIIIMQKLVLMKE